MDFQIALPTGVRDLKLPMGSWTGGGAEEDEIHLPGLPGGLIKVDVSPGHVTIETVVPLVMSGLPLPPKVARLWMPGEQVTISKNIKLRRREPSERPTLSRGADTATWPTKNPTLVCVMGDGLGRTWSLANRELQLGRALNAHVRLHAPSVSRQHAALVQHHSHWLLVPHHTKNPTRLNGKRIAGARELSDGDIIEVGSVALRFQRPYTSTASITSPNRAPRTDLIHRPVRKTPRKLMHAFAAFVGRALCW